MGLRPPYDLWGESNYFKLMSLLAPYNCLALNFLTQFIICCTQSHSIAYVQYISLLTTFHISSTDANEVEHEDEREEGNQVLQPEPEDERLADAVVLAEAERDDDQPEQDQPQQDQPEQDQVEQDRVEQDQVGQDEAGQVENAGQVQVEDENAEDERNAHEAPLGEQGM